MLIALDERYRAWVGERFGGHTTRYFTAKVAEPRLLVDQIRDADVIVCGRAGPYPFDRKVIDELGRAQFVHKSGSGHDWFDVPALSTAGIMLAVNSGYNAATVADHIVMLTLMCLRDAYRSMEQMRNGIWDQGVGHHPIYELGGKVVGIIGLGQIGAHVARRVTAFGAHVIAYQRRPSPVSAILAGVRWRTLDELMAEADVIVPCLPYTRETHGLIGAREIALMKPSAIMVNCSRGKVVDEEALYQALARGQILAAGLDVFAREPTPADNPLLRLENVIATPHTAGGSHDSDLVKIPATLDNVERFLAGERPLRLVNPEIWDNGSARARLAMT